MFKVSFIYNGYSAEVTNDTPDALELDIVELRNVLHRLPPAIHAVAPQLPPRVIDGQGSADVTPMGNGSEVQEIIPVTAITKESGRGGKTFFKVRGGKYEDWGVCLYPDTCIFKDNIVPSLLQNEVVSGLEALVVKQDGKLRVKALRRKAASV